MDGRTVSSGAVGPEHNRHPYDDVASRVSLVGDPVRYILSKHEPSRPRAEHLDSTMSTISVQCLLFARYAELVGRDTVTLELPTNCTAGEAVAALRQEVPEARSLPERPLIAVNREHVQEDRVLADGDELALLPPLAGG